jgi:pyridoxamine 5'-phosphate oxidase
MGDAPADFDLLDDPFAQFDLWYRQMQGELSEGAFVSRWARRRVDAAIRALIDYMVPAMNRIYRNTMVLATSDAEGRPSARVVLLKDHGPDGFTFYTNYESSKGRALAANPRGELVFYWEYPQRQVRIGGVIERVSHAESARYWRTRPRGSQVSQAVSAQSRPLESYASLRAQAAALFESSAGRDIPCPDHWGGYRLRPDRFEFWEAMPDRLHKRRSYVKEGTAWRRSWLAP